MKKKRLIIVLVIVFALLVLWLSGVLPKQAVKLVANHYMSQQEDGDSYKLKTVVFSSAHDAYFVHFYDERNPNKETRNIGIYYRLLPFHVYFDTNDPIELSQEQIDEVNAAFETMIPVEHEEYEYMVNLICNFFGSSYEKPQDMDFTQFIWYFSTHNMMDQPEISEQEFELLKELENFPFDNVQSLSDMSVPIQRKPLKEVNEVLEQYMGITAADLNTEDIPYLSEPYDAFYTYTSDAGFMGFYCTGGEISGDIVRLFSDYATLTLEKKNGEYFITSHIKTE